MHIDELSRILNQYFNFHKARSDCFAQLVIAMITVKTVNFTHLATAFITESLFMLQTHSKVLSIPQA